MGTKEHIKELNEAGIRLVYGAGRYPVALSYPKNTPFSVNRDLIMSITRDEYLNNVS